jgi:biopolymer transport protein TolR
MTPTRIKRHRQRKHGASHFALIPFIDMMTILVVFLLAHTADVDIMPNTKSISIPQSLSERKPNAAVVVMLTKDQVFVDGESVGSIGQVVAAQGAFYAPLRDALVAQNQKSLANGNGAPTDIAKREVTIMGDKDTPYSVLKKIMLTCSEAEYGKVSFAVVERERAAG